MRICKWLSSQGGVGLLFFTLLGVGPVWANPGGIATSTLTMQGQGIRVLLSAGVETTLVSALNGRVKKSPMTLGRAFKSGQILMTFVCAEQDAQVKMGEAEWAAAQIGHENKLKLQALSQAGHIEVALAANEVSRTEAQLALYKAQQRHCTIYAPFDGRVAKIVAKPFQGVSQGQPVLEILSAGPLKVRMNAPAKWLSWLKKGNTFNLEIDETGKRYQAKVQAMNSRVDSVSHTVELEASIVSHAPELLPGMSGIASFRIPH
ncbi:efflux RND transporter periplasmic adaptor subunit [Magnetococcus sp. PR-3]|uniref:efflux RND transporter periplasmic adaptor subunit n=1 Tax=Magnetococcus sp. PR-3 TaxID=3120355 RepID=UPI002FCDF6C6